MTKSQIAYWEYRVVKRTIERDTPDEKWKEDIFYITEVYFDKDDNIICYVVGDEFNEVKPMEPFGISLDDLRGCLNLMKRALKKQVLDYDKLLEIDNG